MEQNVIQIGNSTGMIIPNGIKKALGIKKGSKLFVELNSEDQIVISTTKKVQNKITPEFLSWLKGFNDEYCESLRKLARK